MTRGQAHHAIKEAANADRVRWTHHGAERRNEREHSFRDIMFALANSRTALWDRRHDSWVVTGPNVEGQNIRIAVAINEETLEVTFKTVLPRQ